MIDEPELYRIGEKYGVTREDIDSYFNLSSLSLVRIKNLLHCLFHLIDTQGDTAEIGIFDGGTTKVISMFSERHWACDTFKGLTDVDEEVEPKLANGMFCYSLDQLAKDILDSNNIEIVQGYFPSSAPKEMEERKYKLVHIDVDTYTSVKNCWDFFKDRMVNGGIMILDDIFSTSCKGARKAWYEISVGRLQISSPPQVIVFF